MTARRRILALAQAAGLGLLLARLAIEGLPLTRVWAITAALAAGLALSLGLRALLGRIRAATWPLWLGWMYALWPAPTPDLGLALLVGLTLLICIQSISTLPSFWPEAGAALVFGVLYVATLAPTVLPADAGEFQVVIPLLGIAHPPGYPLYTLLGRLVALLPVGDQAYRANLYAALTSVITLVLVMRCVRALGGGAWASVAAAAALGLSPTFWVQSTTANIRSLTALFTALCLWLAVRWRARPTPRRLAALGLTLGLAIGHHSSLALVALPIGIAVLAHQPRLILAPRRWLGALGAFFAACAVLAYLPLRSAMHPAFDPAPIRSWGDFVAHVLATGFRGDMLYFRTPALLWERVRVLGQILWLEFGPWLLGAMLLAAIRTLWRRRWVGGLLVGVFAVNVLSALTYRAPQTVEYLIPAYVVLAIAGGAAWTPPAGFGARSAEPRRRVGQQGGLGDGSQPLPQAGADAATCGRGAGCAASHSVNSVNPVYSLLLSTILLAAGVQGARSLPSLIALAHDRSARASAEALLIAAPQGALILANWHQATPLWYLQRVEGMRPDLEVRYIYPQGARSNEEVWLERVAEQLDQRPVVVTNRFPAFDAAPYRWIPLAGGWLAQTQPLAALPADLTPHEATVGVSIALLGYALDAEAVQPGQELAVRVAWRSTGTVEPGLSSFVQLLGPQGVVGQADLAQAGTPGVGEVRIDAYRFPLLVQTPPGVYRLVTGFYRTTASGWERLPTPEGDLMTLAEVTVAASAAHPASLHPTHLVWQDGARLVGWDVDRSVARQARLYLHWRGADRSVATTLVALDDGKPLGQIAFELPPRGRYATVVLDLPGDVTRLRLVRSDATGAPIAALGAWGWRTSGPTLRLPTAAVRYIPLGGQMALTAAEARWSESNAAATVELALLALQPLRWDDTLSVGLAGADWERKTDGTPALGAIPTLKWLTGWRVRDRKTIAVDEALRGQPAELTLTVYDAFTFQPLHVLDDRLARIGQGTILRLGPMQ